MFALQTLPACEPDEFADTVGKVSGFSVRGDSGQYPQGIKADERKKLERLSEGGPAVTSAGRPLRKSGFRSRQAATFAISRRLRIKKSLPHELDPARGAGSQADTGTPSEKSGTKRIQLITRKQHPQGIKAPPQTDLFT